VAIVNFGTIPLNLRVFVTNAVSTAKGGTVYQPEGKALGGPANWVTLQFPKNSAMVRVPPRTKSGRPSEVIIPMSVIIPKNATPGDHAGAVIVALYSVIQSKNHAKVHLVQQVADQIIARVSGTLRPQLSVTGLHVTYNDPLSPFSTGVTTMTFIVRNTGNELLGGQLTVSVHGLFGSTETKAGIAKIPILLPGASVPEHVQISGVYPEYLMNAEVSIAPRAVQGQLDEGLETYRGQAGFLAVPWIPTIVVLLLIALAVLIWLRRRVRRMAEVASADSGVAQGRKKVEAS
jgi:hypothetical protein